MSDGFLSRILKRGHERVTAVMALGVTGAALLTGVVVNYVTGKVTAVKEMRDQNDNGNAG